MLSFCDELLDLHADPKLENNPLSVVHPYLDAFCSIHNLRMTFMVKRDSHNMDHINLIIIRRYKHWPTWKMTCIETLSVENAAVTNTVKCIVCYCRRFLRTYKMFNFVVCFLIMCKFKQKARILFEYWRILCSNSGSYTTSCHECVT